MEFINNNEKQSRFAEIRGVVSELNENGEYCNLTLMVGHEKLRDVNIATKRENLVEIKAKHNIGDKVVCKYYPASKKRGDRWHTHLILLSIEND